MTRYKFTIEYMTRDGEQWRTVYSAAMNGAQWFRREEVRRDGNWVERTRAQVTAPTLDAVPIGLGSTFAGP